MTIILSAIGLFIAFIAGIFFNRKTGPTDAQVIDLTNKIVQKQQDVKNKQLTADAKVKAYEDSLAALNAPKPPTES